MQIMIIAGTADARSIIEELLLHGYEVLATVTTSYGKELLGSYPHLEVYQGKLDSEGMETLIEDKDIQFLVDASHPFAREASVNAMAACRNADIPYLRFERESTQEDDPSIIRVKSFEEAADKVLDIPGNIFLTIGSNNIKHFIDRIPNYKDRLFVRILPDSRMLSKCEEAGLTAGNIMAVKGPFSIEMNMEMLKHCNAAVMVTKESGDTGGTTEKLEAAARLDIPVVLIERPKIEYGIKVDTIAEVVRFISDQAMQRRDL